MIALLAAPLPSAEVSAVGDLVIDYGYMEELLAKVRAQQGPLAALDHPFVHVKAGLSGIGFGNMEAPCTDHGIVPFADKNERFYFRMPPRAARSLKRAGFDVLSLANNHIKDCGVTGLLDSPRHLAAQGALAVGVGRNRAEARRPVIVADGGEDVAFLAYVLVIPKSVWATDLTPGAATGTPAELVADVLAARSKTANVVVSLHWGIERTRDLPVPAPSPKQQALARALIDAGASLVLGHHDHTAGSLEEYKGGLIAYSLGNFVFAGSVRGGHKHSYILKARLSGGRLQGWGLLPVQTDVSKVLYQPRPVTGAAGTELLQRYLPVPAPRYQPLRWEDLENPLK